jgi:hypothetical protein
MKPFKIHYSQEDNLKAMLKNVLNMDVTIIKDTETIIDNNTNIEYRWCDLFFVVLKAILQKYTVNYEVKNKIQIAIMELFMKDYMMYTVTEELILTYNTLFYGESTRN